MSFITRIENYEENFSSNVKEITNRQNVHLETGDICRFGRLPTLILRLCCKMS
jgi:hypothetical protein